MGVQTLRTSLRNQAFQEASKEVGEIAGALPREQNLLSLAERAKKAGNSKEARRRMRQFRKQALEIVDHQDRLASILDWYDALG